MLWKHIRLETGLTKCQDEYNLSILHSLLVWHFVSLTVKSRLRELGLNIIYHLALVTTVVTNVTWLIKYQLKRPVLAQLEKHGDYIHIQYLMKGQGKAKNTKTNECLILFIIDSFYSNYIPLNIFTTDILCSSSFCLLFTSLYFYLSKK